MTKLSKAFFAQNKLDRLWNYLAEHREFSEDVKLFQDIFLAGDRLATTEISVMPVIEQCMECYENVSNTADIVLAIKDNCHRGFLSKENVRLFEEYIVYCYVEDESRIVELLERL